MSALALDVTDTESFDEFLRGAKAAMGGLDVLINNAGVMPTGHFLDIDEKVLRRAMDINLLGPTLGMRLALPGMLEQGHGHVVNVASSAGKSAVPGGLYYCSHKSAVIALTEGARLAFGGRRVDFSASCRPSLTRISLPARRAPGS